MRGSVLRLRRHMQVESTNLPKVVCVIRPGASLYPPYVYIYPASKRTAERGEITLPTSSHDNKLI